MVPISFLGELVSIGTLFAFVIVGTGIIILRRSNPGLHRPFKTPLNPFIPIATVLSAAYLMNSLPIDTWVRLIWWMALGLVIYFAYSYTHSKLKSESDAEANVTTPADYKPPVAAIIAMVLAIGLTLYQVPYLMGLSAAHIPLNLVIRLFAWIVTAILVGVLMYGKGDRSSANRSSQVRTVGLSLSLVNLVIWTGVAVWVIFYYKPDAM